MRVTRIEIENFRSIRYLVVDLGETTVFVGPNNAGKTAILDALRIALTRRWGQRGTGFSEYDIHLADDAADPKTSSGVSIELRSEEGEPGEWPDTIAADLGDIVQLDPITGTPIHLPANPVRMEPRHGRFRAELGIPSTPSANRWPAAAPAASTLNVSGATCPCSISTPCATWAKSSHRALRSSGNACSERWRFHPIWNRTLCTSWTRLNRRLLEADPRLQQIAETLSGATRIAARDREGALDLRDGPAEDLGPSFLSRNHPAQRGGSAVVTATSPGAGDSEPVRDLPVPGIRGPFATGVVRAGKRAGARSRRTRDPPPSSSSSRPVAPRQCLAWPEDRHHPLAVLCAARAVP